MQVYAMLSFQTVSNPWYFLSLHSLNQRFKFSFELFILHLEKSLKIILKHLFHDSFENDRKIYLYTFKMMISDALFLMVIFHVFFELLTKAHSDDINLFIIACTNT